MNYIHDESGNIRAYLQQAATMESNAAELRQRAAEEYLRPFYLLKPRVFPDGNVWCALYGENLQEGVAGFGETPHKASIQFDLEWLNSKAMKDSSGHKLPFAEPDLSFLNIRSK